MTEELYQELREIYESNLENAKRLCLIYSRETLDDGKLLMCLDEHAKWLLALSELDRERR